jgi:hypothetical protein
MDDVMKSHTIIGYLFHDYWTRLSEGGRLAVPVLLQPPEPASDTAAAITIAPQVRRKVSQLSSQNEQVTVRYPIPVVCYCVNIPPFLLGPRHN